MTPPNTWENVEQLIKSRIIVDPVTNCWLFQGERSHNGQGYGRIRVGHRKQPVHKIMAVLHLGMDKYDRHIFALHKPECPNKHCCNPEHLYVGTGKDNWADFKKEEEWKVRHLGSRWKEKYGKE